MNRVVIVGAGGQARETASAISAIAATRGRPIEVLGFVISDVTRPGPHDSLDRIIGDLSWLRANRDRFDALALGIGSPAARLRLSGALLDDFDESWWPPLIHPSALYDAESCRFGAGAMVGVGAVLTVNVHLEPFALANFGCTIGHESRLGRGAVVNPGANISGGVAIGAGALIGTGAQVLQYRTIGDGATVGAGAVVTRDVDPGVTVVGIPARRVGAATST